MTDDVEAQKERLRGEVRSRLSREDSEYIRDFYQRHRDATLVIDSWTGLPVEAIYPSAYEEHVKNVQSIAEALVAIRLARCELGLSRSEPQEEP